eukprot:TRINITY_DN11802_c0_g1_i1.p1 TRINITY_DN11802_c0_g1~~TRINITY_DN11802_c0_g1_i1.p1  ORF type:complete len:485 (-),score=131.38 TRINITY_DN11802_c0_g1_i1:4-1458(-)
MTTIADEFLEDMLGSDSDLEQDKALDEAEEDDIFGVDALIAEDDLDMEDKIDDANEEEEDTRLVVSDRLLKVSNKVKLYNREMEENGPGAVTGARGELYDTIVDATKVVLEIDNELSVLNRKLRDAYAARFPELDSVVSNSMDYARVVQRIGADKDLTLVDLSGILPSAMIMVVSVMGSTTKGNWLEGDEYENIHKLTNEMIELDEKKTLLLDFTERNMVSIAPNMCKVVGAPVAAQLLGAAGGVISLSKLPSGNVQLLGTHRKYLGGFSLLNVDTRSGFLAGCELLKKAPKSDHTKLVRALACKVTLAARCDATSSNPDGSAGEKLYNEVVAKLNRMQEPPPAKKPKPLPAPITQAMSKKRGGRKIRRFKDKYFGKTDLRKMQNRVKFGEEEAEVGYMDETVGLGMINQDNSGAIRIAAIDQNKATVKKMSMKKSDKSGLATSVAFTPAEGIELINPNAHKQMDANDGTSTYFSSTGAFSMLR